ncbi:hypothetical protein [Parabacteroides provencensis]|uniref:hypothetical protein n=1 Tax=Parabacteroides provencensis TaxID=1944636 RepID=UPI000C148533|nr:hypothetical protein [Parabacteroides provencensis]
MNSKARSAVSAQPVAVPAANAVLTVSKPDNKVTDEVTKQTSLLPSPELPGATQKNDKKAVSISAIMEKAEKLHLLTLKYEELTGKRKSLDLFAISHDNDNAQLQLADAKGLSFESCNPKCIKKVIDIWKEEFSTAIDEVEKQMRDLISA